MREFKFIHKNIFFIVFTHKPRITAGGSWFIFGVVGLYYMRTKEFPQGILLRNRKRFRGRSSSPAAPDGKTDEFHLPVFQRDPPLRAGEIVFDNEIQLCWMKSASTADGWISFHLRHCRRFLQRQLSSSLLQQGCFDMRMEEVTPERNRYHDPDHSQNRTHFRRRRDARHVHSRCMRCIDGTEHHL